MPTITLEAQNYRALRLFSWTPEGVCVLVGPNGSGKTTAFSLIQFLQEAFCKGLFAAIEGQGGRWQIRNLHADPTEPVKLALSIGDLRWALELGLIGSSIDPRSGERVTCGAEVLVERPLYSDRATAQGGGTVGFGGGDYRPALAYFYGSAEGARLSPFVEALNSFGVFRGYDISGLRRQGSKVSGDVALHPHGENGDFLNHRFFRP